MTSTRLPGKILKTILGKTLLELLVERVRLTENLDEIVIASPFGEEHDPIETLVSSWSDITFVRGDEHNVLSRYQKAAKESNADVIIRITSDCPLYDFKLVSAWISLFIKSEISYLGLSHDRGYPFGLGAEILTRDALEKAFRESKDAYEQEHVTPYIWRRPDMFPAIFIDYVPDLYSWRLAVDEQADFDFVKSVFESLYPGNRQFCFKEIQELFQIKPDLLMINKHVQQKPFINLGEKYG